MKLSSKLPWMLVAFCAITLGAPRASYAAPPADACSLLTPEQVGSALGVKVGGGQGLMGKACKWSEVVKPGASAKRATLNLINPQAFAYAKMPVGNGITKTEVSGIGDDAVYVSAPGAPTTLTVKKRDAAFTVTVFGFSNDQAKDKEKTLALEICSKL